MNASPAAMYPPESNGPARTVFAALLAGLAIVILLFGYEITHYLKATDYGMMDNLVGAVQGFHPQCQEFGNNSRELRCPVPGYGSMRLVCLDNSCTYRDPDLADLTPETRDKYEADIKADITAGREVEKPYMSESELQNFRDREDKRFNPSAMPEKKERVESVAQATRAIFKRDLERFKHRAEEMQDGSRK